MNIELTNLLNADLNKLYGSTQDDLNLALASGELDRIPGEFAAASLSKDGFGRTVVIGARTIGVPARIAAQIVSSTHTRFIVAHTIAEIRQAWGQVPCEKDFDPLYTMMFPAFHRVTIRPWEMRNRDYTWYLPSPEYAPAADQLPTSIEEVGYSYVMAVRDVIENQLKLVPNGTPIGLSLSGGADSGCVASLVLASLERLGRSNHVYLFTLVVDEGGSDYEQAGQVADMLREHYSAAQFSFHPVHIASDTLDIDELKRVSSRILEEYHIRDVECGMASLLLYNGIHQMIEKEELPPIRFDFNGDGGNEIFRDYPLTDEGYGVIDLKDVLEQPFLFLLGYHRSKQAYNEVFSAGLSRGYVRTFNPARLHGVKTFSPMIDRRVIDVGRRIPLTSLAPTTKELHSLRAQVVQAGLRQFMDIELPIFPKARFQEGCAANSKLLRVTSDDQQRLKAMVRGS